MGWFLIGFAIGLVGFALGRSSVTPQRRQPGPFRGFVGSRPTMPKPQNPPPRTRRPCHQGPYCMHGRCQTAGAMPAEAPD